MSFIQRITKRLPSAPSLPLEDASHEKGRLHPRFAFFRRRIRLKGNSSISIPLGFVLLFPCLVIVLILLLFCPSSFVSRGDLNSSGHSAFYPVRLSICECSCSGYRCPLRSYSPSHQERARPRFSAARAAAARFADPVPLKVSVVPLATSIIPETGLPSILISATCRAEHDAIREGQAAGRVQGGTAAQGDCARAQIRSAGDIVRPAGVDHRAAR